MNSPPPESLVWRVGKGDMGVEGFLQYSVELLLHPDCCP
jgi:hypothetical protein